MFNGTRSMLKKIASVIFDIDDTVKPVAQLKLLEDYAGKFNFETKTTDVAELLKVLKKKHLVDEIVVSTMNGSSIVSTNGNAVSDAVTGAALFNYIQSELPKSRSVLIQSNGWYMLFPHLNKLYIVRAAANLAGVELKALAKEIDSFLVARDVN